MFSLSLCFSALDNPGDRPAFQAFYNRYNRLVYYQAEKIVNTRENAEDVAQEVFIYIAKNFDKFCNAAFDPSRLVLICTKSRALNFLRDEKSDHGGAEFDDDFANISDDLDVDNALDTEKVVLQRDTIWQVIQIVSNLPEIYRLPLELKLNDFSNSEISRILNISSEATYKRIQRGYAMIRERMAESSE